MGKIVALFKNKLVLIGLAVLLLGGGGAYYFLVLGKKDAAVAQKKDAHAKKGEQKGKEAVESEEAAKSENESQAAEEQAAEGEGDEAEAAAEEEEEEEEPAAGEHGQSTGPVIDPFIVNLADPGSRRYLRVNLKLELRKRAETEPLVAARMARLRDAVLLLLTSKTSEQLLAPQGKAALRQELIEQINQALKKKDLDDAVKNLYFTEFLIQ
jgi:flagellar FliL protein